MERKKYLVVTAGGTGTRMGAAVPKQFLELDGVPILRRTIEVFLKAVPDIQVITVLPEGHVAYWRQYCLQANFVCPQRLVKGGFTRFHSVKNALKYVPDGALVAVQDGVRPLVSVDKVRELFKAAESAPAVIPVMPVTDTLKVLEKRGGVLAATGETVDRSRIYGAQTGGAPWPCTHLPAGGTLQPQNHHPRGPHPCPRHHRFFAPLGIIDTPPSTRRVP